MKQLVSILAVTLVLNQSLQAEVPVPQPQAPSALPAQIRNAHKIFLANSGAQTGFPYDGSVAYQQLFDDLRSWGRYTIVDSPDQADLVFALRSAAPIAGVTVTDGTGGSYRQPTLELTILDPRTQTHLWVLTQPVYSTLSKKDRTDWFTVAVANLTTKVKELSGDPVSNAEYSQLGETPRAGHHPWIWAVIAIPVVVGVGGGLLLHHEYENSLSDQKAQQDAFCTANHIPLSECAGG